MTTQQLTAFRSLLANWKRHEDLRKSGASIETLALSRNTLDHARLNMARRSSVLEG